MTGHDQPVMHVAFSPDSKIVASTSPSGPVKLWDVATGAVRRELAVDARGLQFSPDGALLACLTREGIRLIRISP